MDRDIKQEPFFEENDEISSVGNLLTSLRPISIKTENDAFHAETKVTAQSIKPDPEPLGLVQPRDAPTSRVLQGAGNEDDEQEESLSDEGIGRSPAMSEHIIQSYCEEEEGTSSAAEGLVSETQVDKELFSCDNCGMAFTDKSHLVRHMKVHTFICQFCGIQFTSDLELLEHEDIHREGQEYLCNECNIIFDSKDALEEHYGNHIYACSLCPKTFTNSIALLNHQQGHQDQNLSCTDCGKIFKRGSNLSVHKRKFCSGRNPSSICHEGKPKGSVNDSSIYKDPAEIDNGGDKMEDFADVNGRWKQDDETAQVETAFSPKRGSDMYFHCSECPQAFSSSEDFARHKLIHLRTCGSSTTGTIQSSDAHVSQESTAYSNGFECKDCETVYPSLAALQRHSLKHIYPCDLCDKTFTNLKKLKKHVRSHNQVFKCQNCPKQFKLRHFLKSHLEKVHGLSGKEMTSKVSSSSTETTSYPTKEARPIVKSGSDKCILGNQVVQEHRSPNLSQITSKRGKGSREPSSNPTKEAKSIQKSSSGNSIMGNQIVQKHSANPSHSSLHDTFSSRENIEKVKVKLERQQDIIAAVEESSAETSLIYKCMICEKSYARKCDLTMHMKRGKHEHPLLHSSSGLQVEVSDDQEHASRSECSKEQPSSTTFKCSVCPKTFSKEYNLNKHMKLRKHKNAGLVQDREQNKVCGSEFHCKICSKTFALQQYLTDHMKCKHPQLKSSNSRAEVLVKFQSVAFQCRKCSKTFRRKCDLTRHMKRGKHQIEPQQDTKNSKTVELSKPFKCTECPKAYGKKFHLREHFKLKHLQESRSSKQMLNLPSSSSFSCRVCSKIFSSRYGLSVHMKLGKHESSSVIQCRVCATIFKQKRYLMDHMRRKHPGLKCDSVKEGPKKSKDAVFPCKRCKKIFYRKSDLTMHMRHAKHKKTSQQVKGAFVAPESNGLRRNYKCGKCPRAYVQNSTLWRHIRLKHPELSSSPGFKCKICFQFFAHKRYLLDHAKRKHPQFSSNYSRMVEVLEVAECSEFHCSMCPKSFHRKCDFTKHMARQHQASQGRVKSTVVSSEFGLRKCFKCSQCPRAYGTRDLLQRHLVLKHPDSIKQNMSPVSSSSMHRCKVCSKTFLTLYELKVHMKLKHKSSVSRKDMKLNSSLSLGIPCRICPKVFAHKRYLARHMKRKHPQDRQCAVIPSKVPIKSSNPSFNCPTCTKKFARKCDLNVHLRRKHKRTKDVIKGSGPDLSQPLMHKCTKCLKTYQYRYSLVRHIREKHPLHQCQRCPKSFAHKRYLAAHVKYKHPKALNQKSAEKRSCFKCPQCPKSFSRQYNLSQHLKKSKHKYNHNRSSVDNGALAAGSALSSHQCPQCPKSFPTKFGLTMHIALGKHITVKDQSKHFIGDTQVRGSRGSVYRCKRCPRVFSRQSDLTVHMKLGRHVTKESAQKVFQCPKCPRSFTRKDSLLKHMEKGDHLLTNEGSKNTGETEGEEQRASSFKCSACARSFAKEGYLSMHLNYCKQQIPLDQSAEGTADEISVGPLLDGKKTKTVEHISAKVDSLKMAWKCPECGKHFANKCDLKRHEDTHVFMCNHCNRFFTTQKSLNEHACDQRKDSPVSHPVVSSPSKPTKNPKLALKCELCRKSFSSSKNLEIHQEQHTLNEFEEDAGTSSTSRSSVKSSNVIPERILICRFCDKVFTSLELVHSHERSHLSSM